MPILGHGIVQIVPNHLSEGFASASQENIEKNDGCKKARFVLTLMGMAVNFMMEKYGKIWYVKLSGKFLE